MARLLKLSVGLLIITLFLPACSNSPKPTRGNKKTASHLTSIKEKKKLVALTDFSAINYFIYRGDPMGYQYELLREFSEYLDIDFEVIVESDLKESFKMLREGKCDLLALNLTVTRDRSEFLRFTDPHATTRQVLVQAKPGGYQRMTLEQMEKKMIRNQLDLAGKTVYVQRNSAYAARMHNLEEEIGANIDIIEVDESFEDLISKVARGEIKYTVGDENMARVNLSYYPHIDAKTAISFPQNLAWAIRQENTDELYSEINKWLAGLKRTATYNVLHDKYFLNTRTATRAGKSNSTIGPGQLSRWDHTIRKYSDIIDWDWRLLASMIYQESRFKPDAVSWVGAFGLMQVMPTTAKQYGVDKNSPPEENIRAGVYYLKWIDDVLRDKIVDPAERAKFVLGAYNSGLGHIMDARALARKQDMDPEIWDGNVAECILLKSSPRYYHDPVVKHGYVRGEEVFNYVKDIYARYEDYKNIVQLN